MNSTLQARRRNWITWALAVLILIPSGFGFAGKFVEFVHTFRSQADGIFAITPMANYMLASLGFLCMLVWATRNGMFHDVERAKYNMLDQEWFLDNP